MLSDSPAFAWLDYMLHPDAGEVAALDRRKKSSFYNKRYRHVTLRNYQGFGGTCCLSSEWFLRNLVAVSTTTGYGLDGRWVGVRVPVGSRFFSSRRPDGFWGPSNLTQYLSTHERIGRPILRRPSLLRRLSSIVHENHIAYYRKRCHNTAGATTLMSNFKRDGGPSGYFWLWWSPMNRKP
jgi:hypothetical protein